MNTSRVEQVLSSATNVAIKSSLEKTLKEQDEVIKKALLDLESKRMHEFQKATMRMVNTAQSVSREIKCLEDRKADCVRGLALLKAEKFNEDPDEVAELMNELKYYAGVDAEYALRLDEMNEDWAQLQLDALPPSVVEDLKTLRGLQVDIEADYRIATGKEDEIKIADNQLKQLAIQRSEADDALNRTLEASDLYNQKLKQIEELQTQLAMTANEIAETRRILINEGYANGVDDYTVMSVEIPQDAPNTDCQTNSSEISADPLNYRFDVTLTDNANTSKRTEGAGDASVNL